MVVDDQLLFLRSLSSIIDAEPDMTVVGQAESGIDAVDLVVRTRPDVVLMDIRMPGLDGIAATRAIHGHVLVDGSPKIVALTMFDTDENLRGMLAAGAIGFLLKDTEPDALVSAVRHAAAGEYPFDPAATRRLIDSYIHRPVHRAQGVAAGLTGREAEVLSLVATGMTNTEIADQLIISVATVKTHVGSLRTKLHARTRARLVVEAHEMGIVGSACPRIPRSRQLGS